MARKIKRKTSIRKSKYGEGLFANMSFREGIEFEIERPFLFTTVKIHPTRGNYYIDNGQLTVDVDPHWLIVSRMLAKRGVFLNNRTRISN